MDEVEGCTSGGKSPFSWSPEGLSPQLLQNAGGGRETAGNTGLRKFGHKLRGPRWLRPCEGGGRAWRGLKAGFDESPLEKYLHRRPARSGPGH